MSAAAASAVPAAAALSSVQQQPPGDKGAAASHMAAPLPHATDSTTTTTNSTLALFLALSATQQRYTAAAAAFEKAGAELDHAVEQKDKYITACTVANAPGTRLPASMALKLVKRSKLADAPEDAAFYAAQIAALDSIERDANQRIYDTLLAAKQSKIAALSTVANGHAFATRSTLEHKQYVEHFAADYDKRFGAASPVADDAAAAASSSAAFPTALAVAHFEQQLRTHIAKHCMLSVGERRAQAEAKLQAAAEEHKGQEKVLAGAHTGQTIAALAESAAAKEIAPLKKQVQQLQQQSQKPPQQRQQPPQQHHRPPRSALQRGGRARDHYSQDQRQGREQHRSPRRDDSRSHGRGGGSAGKRGRTRSRSPRSRSPRSRSPRSPRSRRDSNADEHMRDAAASRSSRVTFAREPSDARSRDRSSAVDDRHQQSSRDHAGHVGNHRTDQTPSPAAHVKQEPKNGEGGDRPRSQLPAHSMRGRGAARHRGRGRR